MAAGLVGDATLTAGLVAAAMVAAVVGWVVVRLRKGESALRQIRRAIERGDHRTALALLSRIRPPASAPARPWHAEQRQLEAECLYAAADIALRDRHFAEALDHYKAVAALVGMDEADATHRVVEAMLAEARRLSAVASDGPALPVVLGLILDRQTPCPEASFWLGLFHLRHNDTAQGIAALQAAHAATEGQQIDPALYLGAAWLQGGKPREALRVLSEANRLAPNCPLVAYQLGVALIESGGDSLLALRALQKATGADGLPKYLRAPQRLWADTLPAGSWVRNLAQRAVRQGTQFQCPLGLDRVEPILQRARLALGEALVTCDRAEEAVPVFTELLTTRDDLPVRRGLGMALAQLGEWDAALPHLRIAYAAEQPHTPATTGAAAVCLVHAAGDRAANIRHALGLIGSLNVRSDAVWARRAGAVFAAAQAAGVPVSAAVVAELADVLASTDAADPTAAAVYNLLATLQPGAISPACARLYVRAAQRHGVNLPNDEKLFDLAITDRAATRRFFVDREWDFDAVERLYLDRWATRRPGSYPTGPGPKYAAEAEAALIADARRLAAHNQSDAAADVAKLALKLNPAAGAAYDLLAELSYRHGDGADATERLKAWRAACPGDPVPLVRLALLAAADHRPGEALATARQALERVRGSSRVPYLLLAARLAIAAGKPGDAISLFDECLDSAPDHPTALAGRVALAWTKGDFPKLVSLADRMAEVPAEDPWYHYLAGAAMLLAGHLDEAEVSAKHAAADPATAAEGRHLLALVRDRRNDSAGAAALLKDAAVAGGAAADHAVALRGQSAWRGGDYAEALRCWQGLPEARLKMWNLATLMGSTAFLAGIQALRAGNSEDAATWLRQAAHFGHADPRLESLITMACTRAGTAGRSVDLLEQAVAIGGARPELARHLARAYRRAGRLADARRLLDRAPADDASLALERGLLSVAEGQLLPAEKAFAAALAHDPDSAAAAVNLVFTRLSLGRVADAAELMPRAAALSPDHKRLLTLLHGLATKSTDKISDWTLNDDRAIVACLRSLGRLESVVPLFDALFAARGQSPMVKPSAAELLPLRAKSHIDRGAASAARELLAEHLGPYTPTLVRNLLGICACFHQDYQRAVPHFQSALPPIGDDARVQQNLALVRGWLGDAERSNAHWRRFLESHAAQMSKPRGVEDYHRQIAALVREQLKESVEVS